MTTELQRYLGALIRGMPAGMVVALADSIEHHQHLPWTSFRVAVLDTLPSDELRQVTARLLDVWHHEKNVTAEGLTLALRAAEAAWSHAHTLERTELTWTGPDNRNTRTRSSAEALLELIDSAEQKLRIVSFAVYHYQPVVKALLAAAKRGVQISMYFELLNGVSPDEAHTLVRRLSPHLLSVVQLYYWPQEVRDTSAQGNTGALHAKIAVADRKTLLISSANLTAYALTINLEAGILIHGGDKPGYVVDEISHLIETGIFQEII